MARSQVPAITVRGARQHNLKNIDVSLPRGRRIVITGPSGCGKSSLAFDTIYAEGQRRYVESLNVHSRRSLELLPRPDVDLVEGLSPAISVRPLSASSNPRSTVGTVTEIYDYLRLLFAKIGEVYSPVTGRRIEATPVQVIVERVLSLPEGTRLSVLAPLIRGAEGDFRATLDSLRKQGFARALIDGELRDLDGAIELDVGLQHTIEVYVDRLSVTSDARVRLSEAVELALGVSGGLVRIAPVGADDQLYSDKFLCPESGFTLDALRPSLFSFNSPDGACPTCRGLGFSSGPDDLTERDDEIDDDEPDTRDALGFHGRCPTCLGRRLRPEALTVRVAGLTIADFSELSLVALRERVAALDTQGTRGAVAGRVAAEIEARVAVLCDMGLGYLTLARRAVTLSSGESERIRLATQIGSALTGVLYVLDEPSAGLHPSDTERLIRVLDTLRDRGNTVLCVEHDREIITTSDWVVDMGPGAGVEGGRVVAEGTPKDIIANPKSVTGPYLCAKVPPLRRASRTAHDGASLRIRNATSHNLRDIDVTLPMGVLTCVTGVSGSGKSSLVVDTLLAHARHRLMGSSAPETTAEIDGLEHFERVLAIDQQPIGRTPRSNPATYSGLFTLLRELFAGVPEARVRGYRSKRFSFNTKGGRCEVCRGAGLVRIEMQFLPDVFATCDACGGRRYNRETLDITYRGHTIADVLDLSVDDARTFLGSYAKMVEKLDALRAVGLGYVRLGQSASTLSGGESQRVKLARELGRRSSATTLFILDEPTRGLHMSDVAVLMRTLRELIDAGHSVVVIEHNLDVIREADWVIDMGPGGGDAGGRVIATGPPADLAKNSASITGRYLR